MRKNNGSEKDLHELMTNLTDSTDNYEMRINVKKPKITVVKHKQGKKVNIVLNGQSTKEADQFK